MDYVIHVQVRSKRASQVGSVTYICGNSDYKIHVDFDGEWTAHPTKTARFTVDGKLYPDVIFTGDQVAVPKIMKGKEIRFGVFAGDLAVTTPAVIYARESILSNDGLPADPAPDVYAQIMEKLNEVSGGGASEADIAAAVEKYLQEHPVEGVTEEEVRQIVDEALPEPYSLPVASADTLGGVKVGEGLQMTGDVLGVVPEPKPELIETIVCNGTYAAVKRTGLSLREMELYITTPVADAAESLGFEVSNDKFFGYAWLSNAINTGVRYTYVHAVSNGGRAYVASAVSQEKRRTTGLSRSAGSFDGTSPIKTFSFYTSNNMNIPDGTTIEIWGVRANA